MFKPKQYVVYPGHGIGVIEKVERKEVLGTAQKYYVLHIEERKMKVMVPVDKAETYGLRPVLTPQGLQKVFEIFRSKKRLRIDKDWKVRYQTFVSMARSHDPKEMAEVLRELNRRYLKDELSIMERKLRESTLRLFVAEVAHVKKLDLEQAEELVKKYLKDKKSGGRS